ncbi:hypothetical protein KP003_16550 [Geomonas nitrogeniifigens]|uniref:hypothetical protein n=1 Tax=Geomonas diazotrophica TaxID=2843197 RepID=UPI001C2BAAC5|nr:hypothetical protein [Geomonas nitrogeniifigens]QXE85951.1 hypothetical protein KP003_16550 [Geomonas nitrogeniifigens]
MYRALILITLILSGCNTITVNLYGDSNRLTIEQPKTVATSPTLSADGNQVPLSALP